MTADVKTTALLLLDFGKQNCGQRPRCVAIVPNVQKFADEARAKGVSVVHSLFGQATEADLLIPPKTGEPSVRSARTSSSRPIWKKSSGTKGSRR